MFKRVDYTKQELIKAVSESKSYAQVLRKLGRVPKGGNYQILKNKIEHLNLDISHFTGQGWNVGLKFKPSKPKPLDEILVKNSSYSTYKLKKRLFKRKLKDKFCENCERDEWLGKPIPLELHHINGDARDHRLENLQILCPNCHATTDSYRGKNKRVPLKKFKE